jgi:sugar lactone lactonase YvrE
MRRRAAGRGSTFYAGDLFRGDIFRGDIRKGTAELFIDAPDGRMAVGMAVDLRHDLLFVAGGTTGQAYVYDTRTGATVATYDLGEPATTLVNDVTVTPSGGTLLVAPTPLGKLCTVDPRTGASELVEGVDVPLADGLVLDGRRLWVVQTFTNQISRWRLDRDLGSGTPDGVITDSEFRVPLTAARFGNRLAVVNSHLDTGYPPTHPTYEILVVRG